jgi:hypothetical protein
VRRECRQRASTRRANNKLQQLKKLKLFNGGQLVARICVQRKKERAAVRTSLS